MTQVPMDAIRTDPTRMAQGIMTGIGFLGAGVIFKEGLTVRGLTTAASIWITASIGILVGIGFWFAAIVGTIATLLVLACSASSRSGCRASSMPTTPALHARPRDGRGGRAKADRDHGFSVANLSSRLIEEGRQFEYRMVIRSRDRGNADRLSSRLRDLPDVVEFRISPIGD